MATKPVYRDYTVGGPESDLAQQKGLASGQWFVPFVERKTMRRLMQRDDYHATRDTLLLVSLVGGFAYASYCYWWQERYGRFALCFWVYCTLYCSSADSRWHECGHATAFKTKWKNDLVYEIASFAVFREPLVWRFSHARHHTDTDIVGRDPEIDGRPLDMWNLGLAFLNYQGIKAEAAKIWSHAKGELSASERSFVPASEAKNVYRQARQWLCVYAATCLASLVLRSPLPCMYVFLPYTLGAWHFVLTGVFQHASLEHDVLDHRRNTRTCYVNPISAFIYWNMHYHIEHHMFPMVPYFNLPELHAVLQAGGQMPKPYGSMWEVYREMIPALIKQCTDPNYFTKRPLPPPLEARREAALREAAGTPDADGWVHACDVDEVPPGDMLRFEPASTATFRERPAGHAGENFVGGDRFEVGARSYNVYHAEDDGLFYATAGKCTHGAAYLADGLVVGNLVECPKHNGCFDFKTGLPKRLPVKARLATFPTKVERGAVFVQVAGNKATTGLQLAYDKDPEPPSG